MNEQQIREMIIGILGTIAPEANLSTIQADSRFRDQYEFDSIDCLNLITAIVKELKIDIPEIDYPKLGTLNGCIRYITGRV
jgi:acyl carrier protein